MSEITEKTGRTIEAIAMPSSVSNMYSMHALLKAETNQDTLQSSHKKERTRSGQRSEENESAQERNINEDLQNVIKNPSFDSTKRASISTTYA